MHATIAYLYGHVQRYLDIVLEFKFHKRIM